MKKTNLVRLMQRYITGQVTEQEKLKIEAWLDVKKTEDGAGMVLDEEDEERLFRKITASIDNVEEIKSFQPKESRIRSLFSYRWFQVAATLLILVLASYSVWWIAVRDNVHEILTYDNTEKVILEDGTIVWLREQSRLTYVNNSGVRKATLEGEGLFEVAKDPARPFTVSCHGVTVKVFGTSFNLKSGEQGIELKVLTGKVNLSSEADRSGIDVTQNEMVVYTSQREIEKLTMSSDEVMAVTTPTGYNMEFKNTAMEKVISRLERKFDVKVVIEDNRVNDCRITADFTDHSLESTLNMMAELLEIEYSIKKSTVTITGKGCN